MRLAGMGRHVVLAAILLGAFALVLTNSAFNLLLPALADAYGASASAGGWMIAAYMLAMTVAMPLAAPLVDRIGKKRTYLAGLGLFGLSSVAGGQLVASPNVVLLVRALHGVAAGLMIPLSLALLFDRYGQEARGRVVGAWGMLLTLAPAIGPSLGGAIVQFGEPRYLFWMNVPFALLAFLLCRKHIQPDRPARRKTIRPQGILLLVYGIGALSFGLQTFANADGKGTPVLLLASGAAALALYIRTENGTKEPLIRYRLLRRNRIFAAALVVSTIQDCVMFGVIFVLPLLFQETLSLPPSVAGALFIPTAVCTSLFAWIAGSRLDAGKPRGFITLGVGFLAVSASAFAFVPHGTPLLALAALMALRGIGNGLSDTTMTAIGLNALPEEDVHEGSAVSNTIQRLTSSLAVMLLAVYYEIRTQSLVRAGELAGQASDAALREECFALGALMALALPLALFLTGKKGKEVASNAKEPTA